MTVEELIVYGKKHQHSDHAKIILAELLDINVLELLNHLDDEVDSEKEHEYKNIIEDMSNGVPIQYALGYVNFYGNKLYVNKNVLIPRFETEELVEKTVEYINKYFSTPVDIIDLGCGSGAIGLTLEKKVSTKTVDLIDISKAALEVTHKNCGNLKSKANLIQSDMFENVEKKYDIIISNPPYIRINEEIEEIVKNNEPHLALYAGEDGLYCYRKILSTVEPHMKDKCIIAFEIGMNQAEDISKIAHKYLSDIKIEVKKDLSEKDRMLFIFKNCE